MHVKWCMVGLLNSLNGNFKLDPHVSMVRMFFELCCRDDLVKCMNLGSDESRL